MDSAALKCPLAPPQQPAGVELSGDPEWQAIRLEWNLFNQDEPPAADREWRALRDKCLKELGKSRDFEVLAHLAAAAIRLDGWSGYSEAMAIADAWITDLWDAAYPRVNGNDCGARSAALSLFAHPSAVLPALRRLPILPNAPDGPMSLRDLVAAGLGGRGATDAKNAARADVLRSLIQSDPKRVNALRDAVRLLLRALNNLDSRMAKEGGPQARPDFAPLTELVSQLATVVGADAAATPTSAAVASASSANGSSAAAAPVETIVSAASRPSLQGLRISSRAEADQALEAVAIYMSTAEPTNPVPILIASARRLLTRTDFLALIEDLAPEAAADMRKRLLVAAAKTDSKPK